MAVLNWNLTEETIRCLESCLATTHPNVGFLLVDNGSSDPVVDALKSWADRRSPSWRAIGGANVERPANRELSIVFAQVNSGYAGGNNIALRCALAWDVEWVLILNNDATITPDYLTALVLTGTRFTDAGMIGSRQSYDPKYNLQPSCGVRISYNLGAYPFWRYRCAPGTRSVNFAPGNSVLIRTGMLRGVGLFDERYFLYSEDLDLSHRAMGAGWKIVLNLDVTTAQGVSTSLGGRRSPTYYYYLTRNTLLLLSERLAGWRRGLSITVFLGMMLVRSAIWLLEREPQKARAAYLGLRHFLEKRFGQAPDAAKYQSRTKR